MTMVGDAIGDGDDKAAAILQAAVKIFSRHGPSGARVGDIARTAGVGKGTIYEYFASKEELFERMILYSADVQVLAVTKALAAGQDLQASLQGALLASLELVESHQALVRVVMDNVTGGPSRELRQAMFQRQQRLITAIKETFRRHGLQQIDPPAQAGSPPAAAVSGDTQEVSAGTVVAAHMFLGILQTLSVARLLQQDPNSAKEPALAQPAAALAKHTVHFFLHGLGNLEPRR